MKDRGWRLGPHGYVPEARLPRPEGQAGGPGCTWTVVRRDGEGPRSLLQLWEPRPPGPVLDTLREEFLERFSRTEAMDPGACHLGFDADRVWFLQELAGTPLPQLWAQAGRAERDELRARILAALDGSRVPRLLLPEVIGVHAGRPLAPRVLGPAPWDRAALQARLEQAQPPGPGGERPWAAPPDLADGSRLPLRGRMRELTYVKSLMLGLGAAIPNERVLILQGEAGLGHGRLCAWAAAVAETEGIWVSRQELRPGERSGEVLERLLADLIAGQEAELYAAHPGVARALSRRLAAFAFLGGGRRSPPGRELEPAELKAALAAIGFAQARHPRMVLVRGVERAEAEVPALLQELVLGSGIPWVLSVRGPGRNPGLRLCLGALKHSPVSATVVLDRLEDAQLGEVLGDLLEPHDLPEAFRAELAAASLGNPGLMLSILARARAQGAIRWDGGRWVRVPDGAPGLEVQEDLVAGILLGRLHRLDAAALGVVRCLALADAPLAAATLGRALGLDPDAAEEALNVAAEAGLALAAGGAARIAGPKLRDLAVAQMPGREAARVAQALLRLLLERGGRPGLAARLQAFAADRATALAQVFQALEHERPGPLEARRCVEETLALGPDPLQEARLWEFLADAWGRAMPGDGIPAPEAALPAEPGPPREALAALDLALQALGPMAGWKEEERAARLQRKRGLLELVLGRLEASQASLRAASALLADHPFHPEQPRLRLAASRLHLGRGDQDRALAALEEGLELLDRGGAAAGHPDRMALLLELGRAQGEAGRFPDALAALEAPRRQAERDGDQRLLAEALEAQGQVRLALGQPDPASRSLRAALDLARSLDDPGLLAACGLQLGIHCSWRQLLGPARDCLDDASRRFVQLGDSAGAARVQAWQARNLAALGEHGLAELLLLRAADAGGSPARPADLGERAFLDGECAGFRSAWGEARRHYLAAANRFAHAGLAWRERLARLRCIQAEAQEAAAIRSAQLDLAWTRLEQLRDPVAGAGSRWLELEWQRARAQLLAAADDGAAAPDQTVLAWGEVLAGARELRFPAMVLEAGARSSELLLGLGEKLGARSRIQDALPSAMELWAALPAGSELSFLGRSDIHGFREAAEMAGARFAWPPRADPLPDWNLTEANPSASSRGERP